MLKKVIGITTTGLSVGFFYNFIKKQDERSFTYQDVSKHNKMDKKIWVTYKNEVFDITDFLENHPGGKDKIMLAAGKGLEPYWNTYKQHTNNKTIVDEILKPMKIGTLKDYDKNKYQNTTDPYINDPERDSDLHFHSISPCNAETPKDSIMDNWITPNELWYIRNHHPVPNIDIGNFSLFFKNKEFQKSFSLEELKKMPSKKVITTIQCGGNRRGGLNIIDKTSGTPWDFGAISTAEWEGVLLRDLLNLSKIDNDINHVQFEGYEGVKSSIPIEKAIGEFGDVIIAYKMNGEDIPRDHGYPLRLIVPGHVGIRNIKWLKSITTSDVEAEGIWQRGISYKGVPSYIKDANQIDVEKLAAIQEMPVQSCIVDVKKEKDNITVKGFAWSGGGRGIIRVDVSSDGGKNWKMATLKEGSEQKINRAWAWTFWEAKFNSKESNNNFYCKATDSSYNIQPQSLLEAWNLRGLNNNSWHKI